MGSFLGLCFNCSFRFHKIRKQLQVFDIAFSGREPVFPSLENILDKIILQGTNLQITGEVSPNSLRRGDRASKSCVIGHFMQEGGAA